MNRIQDKKLWWAMNFCRPTVKAAPNPALDILGPIGLVLFGIAVVALLALSVHASPDSRISLADTSPAVLAVKEMCDRIHDKYGSAIAGLTDRMEELESRGRLPLKPDSPSMSHEEREHLKAFTGWIRKRGESPAHEQKLLEYEAKDVTVGSSAGGGYALPKVIAQRVLDLEIKMSPVRLIIPVTQVSTTDYHELLGIRGATSGWVGETTTRTPSNTPQLRDILPTFGEIYAYPQCSEWSLDDLQFNVEDWLVMNIATEFSYQEGVAVIRGNGTNKPTGMLNTTPVTTADWASPLRTAAAYQYISSTASPFSVTADSIIDLQYTLNSAYRSNAVYVMNSNTAASIRKLKDTTNQYLWQQSLIQGQPSTLAGYPVYVWEDLDDIGSAKFPVAFGDFSQGYLLANRVDLRITRDPYTTPGQVKFYVRRRVGGIVKNNDAIKWIRTS